MKKLDQQISEVNMQLDTQAEKDAQKIDQLSQDRERLHAELTRVSTHNTRSTTPQRMRLSGSSFFFLSCADLPVAFVRGCLCFR